MRIRTPYDPQYTALVGTAVYIFACYEWSIIYLIDQFKPGFVGRYSRGKPMTSGAVKKELQSIIKDPNTSYSDVPKAEIAACYDEFDKLVDLRNALIHAHPVTDYAGSQMLNYQTSVDRNIPDMKWSESRIRSAIQEFDEAAHSANKLLHRLLP